jgi:hypothetical protein
MNAAVCRLCAGPTQQAFEGEILGTHHIGYFLCSQCGSLQTEAPYWLEQAYDPRNERFDTGQVFRSLGNAAFLLALHEMLGVSGRLIDYGCGAGLAVRLLRDVGVDAWGHDRYCLPRFALGYQTDALSGAGIVNLCEVAEHFDQPGESFAAIFAADPPAVVLQTAIFERPDPRWPYLAPEHGQHVFFYSLGGLDQLARRHGRAGLIANGYVLLLKPHLIPRLGDPATGQLHAACQERFERALPELFRRLGEFQYRYAQRDNMQLSQASRSGNVPA